MKIIHNYNINLYNYLKRLNNIKQNINLETNQFNLALLIHNHPKELLFKKKILLALIIKNKIKIIVIIVVVY